MLERKNENEMSIPNLYYLRNFEIASPEPGDVIRVKRFCCNKSKRNHYGIYIGNNEVVYFDDTVKDRTKRLVKKVSFASFRGKTEWGIVRYEDSLSNHAEETIKKATSMLGENDFIDCCCFVEWCKLKVTSRCIKRSEQDTESCCSSLKSLVDNSENLQKSKTINRPIFWDIIMPPIPAFHDILCPEKFKLGD